jgi:hypothetical protein
MNRSGVEATRPPSDSEYLSNRANSRDIVDQFSTPSVFSITCLQCDAKYTAVLYLRANALELAVLAGQTARSTSPDIPKAVVYYLDQATRCRSVGAYSAAMPMFRSAAEWLLEHQGFTRGLIGDKLNDLEKRLADRTAPKWANDISSEALVALKKLGNIALHTNGGDFTRQEQLDSALCSEVQAMFEYLIEIVYEQPAQVRDRIAKLKAHT